MLLGPVCVELYTGFLPPSVNINMDETRPLLEHIDNSLGHSVERPLVDFDLNGDPENPMDWSGAYKRGVVILLAVMAFTV